MAIFGSGANSLPSRAGPPVRVTRAVGWEPYSDDPARRLVDSASSNPAQHKAMTAAAGIETAAVPSMSTARVIRAIRTS